MECCEVQGPDPSCLGLEIRPTFISSRVTQISTDPLTLSSPLAQVWLPHPRLICLTSFPLFNPFAPLPRFDLRVCVRQTPAPSLSLSAPASLPVFHPPSISLALAFSPWHAFLLFSPWHRTPPMLRPELSLHCWRQVAKDTSTERHSLNVIRWER